MAEYINSFPGYEYKWVDGCSGKQNMYRGVNLGFGGYVYFEEGIYTDVALLDIQSLHPHSIISMNKFGKYTQRYEEILKARIAIKNHDYETAGKMLGGAFKKFLVSDEEADKLASATKLILNSTYGFCSASFENPFRDSRDRNNTVALKGALFMKTLQDEVQKRGFTVAHIKTDSIKVPNATKEIVEFIMDFAKPYGYTFEFEGLYDRMCLVNGSTYIAKYASPERCQELHGFVPKENKKHPNQWTATAKQFKVPYVFKTLFSKEPIEFKDLCETFEVKTAIYLDRNEDMSDVTEYEKEIDKLRKQLGDRPIDIDDEETLKILTRIDKLEELAEMGHDRRFVGKVGNFCPIKPGEEGGILVRQTTTPDGKTKYTSVTGTLKPDKTPYRWLEAEFVKTLGKEDCIDKSYYKRLVDDAVEAISQYGDFEQFVSDEPYHVEEEPKPEPEQFISVPDHPPVDDDDLPRYISGEEEELFKRR